MGFDAVAQGFKGFAGESLVHGFDLLQAGDIGLGFGQPIQQGFGAGFDAVDVEGGYFHGSGSCLGLGTLSERRCHLGRCGLGSGDLGSGQPHLIKAVEFGGIKALCFFPIAARGNLVSKRCLAGKGCAGKGCVKG